MLQFTVDRVHRRWPSAQVSVLTTDQEALRKLVPKAQHLLLQGRDSVVMQDRLFSKLGRGLSFLDRGMWRRFPAATERLMIFKSRLGRRNFPEITRFKTALTQADCVIASGGGYITDEFPKMIEGLCGTLSMAQRHGKPTAMFGQGLGPIEDPYLTRLASQAMKNIVLLGLREPVFSPAVAESLGVPKERTTVTGDNATVLAFQKRKEELGNAVGINVRVAGYSRVGQQELDNLRNQIRSMAESLSVDLIPILISKQQKDDEESAALCPPERLRRIPMDSPDDTINAISMCRIVITGSYHAAVFALSQGIPVIGLAKSQYYRAKFEGLRGLYPVGMAVVNMADLSEPGALLQVASELYEGAKDLRDNILQKSSEIVDRSEKLYSDFFDMFPG